jgi:hypothetical protein
MVSDGVSRSFAMPLHDWTRVEAGIFHGLHLRWIAYLTDHLNRGLLPPEYYAEAEQYVENVVPDVLTLQAFEGELSGEPAGSTALAVVGPKLAHRELGQLGKSKPRRHQKHVVVRHTSGHRVVAVLEIVSPANKDRKSSVRGFAEKVQGLIRRGIHAVVLDVLPPTVAVPGGIHAAIWSRFHGSAELVPSGESLVFASYSAGRPPEAFYEFRRVGDGLPEVPLFLTPTHYVTLPLGETYDQAFAGTGAYWRNILLGEAAVP